VTTEVLPLAAACERYGADWERLVRETRLDMSMLPGWLAAAAHAHGLEARVRVAVARTSGEVAGVLPFLEIERRMHGLTVLVRELPGNALMCYHPAFVTAAAHEELLQAVLSAGPRPCDVLAAPAMDPSSAGASAVRRLASGRGLALAVHAGERSPFLPIDRTWDELLASKSSNFRYTLQRKEKALKKRGQVTEREYRTPADVAELLRAMLHVEARSWKVTAGMAVSDRAVESRYYELLLPWLAERGALYANSLLLDGEPIAYSLCYVWLDRFAQAKTTFDEQHKDASPGLIVNRRAIEHAFRAGAREFDFLGDVMPHKTHWTAETRTHESLFVFNRTWRGVVLGAAKALTGRLGRREAAATVGRGEHVRGET
jgi:CelD/BcsL family acetyltransferase involved in cellulose biosynthesis